MSGRTTSLARRTMLGLTLMTAAACGGAAPTTTPNAAIATAVATATVTSTPSQTPPPAPLDPCKVVTLDDAQQLAGTPLDPGMEGPPGASICTYGAPVTGPTAQVVVELGDKAKQILDVDRQLGNKLTPLPGIGDEAYEEDNNVFVRKGTLWCVIHLVRLTAAADNRVPLEELLKKAVTRI